MPWMSSGFVSWRTRSLCHLPPRSAAVSASKTGLAGRCAGEAASLGDDPSNQPGINHLMKKLINFPVDAHQASSVVISFPFTISTAMRMAACAGALAVAGLEHEKVPFRW